MAQEVIMPKAGMSMEEGKVVRWLKKIGDAVEAGEPLLEIETDKVNMEVESVTSGFLIKILAQEGETIPVTKVIGYIGAKDETIMQEEPKLPSAPVTEIPSASVQKESRHIEHDTGKIPATPLAKVLAAKNNIALDSVQPSGKFGQIIARDIAAVKKKVVTPLARKVAEAKGIGIEDIQGSGKKGRVYRDDVLKAIPQEESKAVKVSTPVPLSGMRKVIAQRMIKSHLEIPPVTLNTKADMTTISRMRLSFNEKRGLRITFNDIIVWIAGRVFKEMPEVNIAFSGEGVVNNEGIHIGIAVALNNGLIVPVLRNTDTFSLGDLSKKAKELIEKAREGALLPDDYSGGTFTVSNLGMYGITSFTPIINQPESMILGVCAIEPTLVMDDEGKLEKHSFMGLSLTFDHRCLDGAQAATFLKRIVYYLENPDEMML